MQKYFSLLFTACLLGGCAAATTAPVPAGTLAIRIKAFGQGETIPPHFTCSGADRSPAIEWSGAPAGTRSLALIVDDPDAPFGTFVHWVLYNIPASRTQLDEGVPKTAKVEGLGQQGKNGFGATGYNGPCPPAGKAHRYYFKLYALDLAPDLPAGQSQDRLLKSMEGHILAQTEWMGQFAR